MQTALEDRKQRQAAERGRALVERRVAFYAAIIMAGRQVNAAQTDIVAEARHCVYLAKAVINAAKQTEL